jgi:hypothetical protein
LLDKNQNSNVNALYAEAIHLFNKHKGTWTISTKALSFFLIEDNKKATHNPLKCTNTAPGMLKTHDTAGNPIDRKPPGGNCHGGVKLRSKGLYKRVLEARWNITEVQDPSFRIGWRSVLRDSKDC